MKKIVFFGAGNIAQALIEGMLSSGINKKDILFIDRNTKNKNTMKKIGIREYSIKKDHCHCLFFLAVKPKDALNAFEEICRQHKDPTIVSLVAGIKSKRYLSISKDTQFIRAMPNIPSKFNKGITAIYNVSSTLTTLKKVKALFKRVGIALEIDKESKMDDFTGLIGSGPAYFFYLLKIYEKRILKLSNGNTKLKDQILGNLMEGIGIASKDNKAMDELISVVASKKGTTEAGLKSFKSSKILNSFEKGIIAAINRSKEISNEF
jgi:pyrroline-5-carboxylate reductase